MTLPRRPTRSARRSAAAVLLGLGLGLAPPCAVPQSAADQREDEVKALYLYNFMQFAQWPDAANGSKSLNLCSPGVDVLRGKLAALAGRPAQGHVLAVQAGAPLPEITACHAVFVAERDAQRLPAIVHAAHGLPVLVISDVEGSLARGAAIELRPLDRRIVFAVNRSALKRAGVSLPASVLRLAVEVAE